MELLFASTFLFLGKLKAEQTEAQGQAETGLAPGFQCKLN